LQIPSYKDHKKIYKLFIHQATDRMMLLLTMLLISTTNYVAVEAPPKRGMSYIEIWIIGMQIPTLIAIFETGFVLLRYRKQQKLQDSVQKMNVNKKMPKSVDIKKYDIVTGRIGISTKLQACPTRWLCCQKQVK
jgi:hypothetical protein